MFLEAPVFLYVPTKSDQNGQVHVLLTQAHCPAQHLSAVHAWRRNMAITCSFPKTNRALFALRVEWCVVPHRDRACPLTSSDARLHVTYSMLINQPHELDRRLIICLYIHELLLQWRSRVSLAASCLVLPVCPQRRSIIYQWWSVFFQWQAVVYQWWSVFFHWWSVLFRWPPDVTTRHLSFAERP